MTRVDDDTLRTRRQQLLAEVGEIAPDPDRQDELVSTMQEVEIIDELLLFRAATAARPERREALLQTVAEARAILDEPEAIIRALAAGGPLVASSNSGDDYCMLCETFRDRNPGKAWTDLDEHDDDCVWRRAVEWVAAHPGSAGMGQGTIEGGEA
jgi:hypothetical protein